MAVVSVRGRQRIYRSPTDADRIAAAAPAVEDPPTVPLVGKAIQNVALYGVRTQADLYSPRQMFVLDAFTRAVSGVYKEVLANGGTKVRAQAISAFLGLTVSRLAQFNSRQVRWHTGGNNPSGRPEAAFGRHDLPMTWDFVEINPFGGAVGDFRQLVDLSLRALEYVPIGEGVVSQADARTALANTQNALIATDPPYFDQISYADLADYFYVWQRRALRDAFPELYRTVASPKDEELTALSRRHGGSREAAKRYFIDGFSEVFAAAGQSQHPDVPLLVVYAFKEQARTRNGDGIAPGWEAILEAVVSSGLMIVGTWPIHGTGSTRMISMGANALATYVVLVCRPRPERAQRTTRSEFSRLLRNELATAVADMQHANIAPVDLAQAVIGPGMQVYSRHSAVIETDGSPLRVAEALGLINRSLAEVLDEQEGDLDPDSRWAVTWYDDHGFDTAAFGKADQLARAKGIAVDSLVEAGIVTSGAGKVALISRDAFREGWDPATDRRATAWEAVQYLVRSLAEGGERAAAELYARLGGLADPARELAYRLFQIAEKKGRTEEAIAYNGLVTSWSEVARLADDLPRHPAATGTEALF
jgi:putative DNA methylase